MSAEESVDGGDDERGPGIREGVERSSGDPKVLLAMNAVLSTWFAWMVVWGLDLLGAATLSARNVATLALILFAATYVAVLR
ncbi:MULTISPECIES: hypothetical protein [Halorubrum]|jgi:hypothetical protein|uniref:DUF8107 domain-containing protein n=1 Tax=Halorubrum tropicale TaxID=1765655 RepID=A0A0M9AU63_9EURY|nr:MULTISPECIES: hypothetical protein [Halorubrum]KOX97591.1 hypothetical protein AMR74_01430 [Halorubrum tropicale]RLM50779.1 hypothetical protein DVK06_07665 [Halorubrum sp. Atlit-28R]TKX43344.1 hypothetical protein EXE50_10775 [Halorubrum sp. ARQ200]TKX49829.1 hypothetical protein EXE49_09925 [Halorubrum sp. ASP121]TKX58029.1 hypothetical protein EXE48_17210 [Halorubrum sp. ASP1]